MSNISDTVYKKLRYKIISGELIPGLQLKEEEVSSQFGVSRTPVRSAFQALINDGLLVKGTNRGVFLAEWTMNDIEEVFRLRMLLEPHATGQAALKASKQEIDQLYRLACDMESLFNESREDNIIPIQKNNHEFHMSVIQFSRSPRLQKMIKPLVKAPMVIGAFHVYDETDIKRSIMHHHDIVIAISMRNQALAEQMMRVHLNMAYTSFMKSHEKNILPSALSLTEV